MEQLGIDFTQRAELKRVTARIGREILAFLRARLTLAEVREDGAEFFADDLRSWVEAAVGKVAPGSADRILRALRQEGRCGYRVLNRAKSLYCAEWVG